MSAAAFHRAVGIDTRISVAIAELTVGSRIDPRLAARIGIDLAPLIATLERHLDTLRAELHRMTADPYPQQPGDKRFIDLWIGCSAEIEELAPSSADDGGAAC